MRKFPRLVALIVVSLAASLASLAPEVARAQTRHVLRGIASWYGRVHHGRRTASGVRFDMNALTAAHRTLPFGTRLRVTHVRTGRSVEVVVNDRGPYVGQRILDLSRAAAARLGVVLEGVADVRLEILVAPPAGRGEWEREPHRSAASLVESKRGPGMPAATTFVEPGPEQGADARVLR